MRTSILWSIAAMALTVLGHPAAKSSADRPEIGDLERVIIYVVQLEAQASHLNNRTDLCIGFGHGLRVDDKKIVAELAHRGLGVHPNEWCSLAQRAIRIGIIAPISETSASEYRLVLELGNMSIEPSEHFATLLRRGTYVVRFQRGHEPQPVSYQETCCPKTD